MLSIIIVNWKVRDLLEQCLRSIPASLQGLDLDYELLVVDNDSGDGSVEMVRKNFPAVTVIANPDNRGFGVANNQAFSQSRGSVILLLNPDTICPAGELRKLVEHFLNHPEFNVMGCRLLNKDGSLQRWTGGTFLTVYSAFCHYFFVDKILPARLRPASLYLESDVAEDVQVDWVSGACMMLRRTDFPELLFDPQFFMYGEDMELCYRIKKAGGTVVYTPHASIVHIQGASMTQQHSGVMQNSLKGPRAFYLLQGTPFGARMIDFITMSGFGLRWALYRGLQLFSSHPRRRHYADRAVASGRYLSLAWKVALSAGRGATGK